MDEQSAPDDGAEGSEEPRGSSFGRKLGVTEVIVLVLAAAAINVLVKALF